MNSRVIYSVIFFILLLVLLYTSKSSIMFEQDGKEIKKFGLGHEQTLFSFGIFTIVLAIASFYLFCIIDLIFGSSSHSSSSIKSSSSSSPSILHNNSHQYAHYVPPPPPLMSQAPPPPHYVTTHTPQYTQSDIYKNF